MRYSNVTSTLALVVALGGTSYAAIELPDHSVGRQALKKGAVGTVQVADGTLLGVDFKQGERPRGLPGPTGPTGATGSGGAKGDAGTAGAKGDQGAPGAKGDIGLQGPKGLDGTNGSAGPAGPTGLRGPTGNNGVNGVAGPTGLRGPTGPTGPAGLTTFTVRSVYLDGTFGGHGIVNCLAGETATGGGITADLFKEYVNGSEPYPNTGTPTGWQGWLRQTPDGSLAATGTLYVVCAKP